MNTKVDKLKELYNMQLHNAETIVRLIEDHIPKRSYTTPVHARLRKKNISVSDQVVRDVKLFRTKNIQVLDVILEIAQENKQAHEKLEKSVAGN